MSLRWRALIDHVRTPIRFYAVNLFAGAALLGIGTSAAQRLVCGKTLEKKVTTVQTITSEPTAATTTTATTVTTAIPVTVETTQITETKHPDEPVVHTEVHTETRKEVVVEEQVHKE